VIQTIDSIELAERVARLAEAEGKRLDVLVEVNVGDEAQKSGAEVADVPSLVKRISAVPSLHLAGLMAIPPFLEPEEVRPYFRKLRALRDDLGLVELSMGMTDDFEVAIEEGATIVRVGRAIFGARG
jgi:PLP dependent protein